MQQGDLLHDCLYPIFPATAILEDNEPIDIAYSLVNAIVVTQSCDLANRKVEFVTMCRYYTISEYESRVPELAKSGRWEQVRQGRVEGLHLLRSPVQPEDARASLVVDFRLLFCLPFELVERTASRIPRRLRLNPPYREHFSQSFARSFMRVGLPSDLPRFVSR